LSVYENAQFLCLLILSIYRWIK